MLKFEEFKKEKITTEEIKSYTDESFKNLEAYTKKLFNKHSNDQRELAYSSFKESVKITIKEALTNYYIKFHHYKNPNYDIKKYLVASVKTNVKKLYDSKNYKQYPICPVCSTEDQKVFLQKRGKKLHCSSCEDTINVLENKDLNAEDFLKLKQHKAFVLHSRSGYKCSSCKRFIPNSYFDNQLIKVCPYVDCLTTLENPEKGNHPTGKLYFNNEKIHFYIDQNKSRGENYDESSSYNIDLISSNSLGKRVSQLESNPFQDNLSTDLSIIDPEQQLNFINEQKKNIRILKEVIVSQRKSLETTCETSTAFNKIIMYEAFEKMLELYPDDMVSYLVYLKNFTKTAIQSKIFQVYASLIEQKLPCTIKRLGQDYEVYSLLDPNLDLYTGVSVFESYIDKKYMIPNETIETYNNKKRFIGKIASIKDNKDNDLLPYLKEYSFSKIYMSNECIPGTVVKVTHFNIASHYDIGSLVHLQKTRRRIVDSVYKRLNGKDRSR